ncbi:Anaerobic ribonucleoside-triphosphate reductase [Alloiococcus otitis]|uniref:Anaerobic ribonucleoside-triphosphate reductase n=1 Tax=Alloiococcus otitis ATCC 51267 TaxID=883081 RepID=K9ERT9_9LACT|nr:anaerobic ribonucleoside-triphosphate reductase [Alloiococcus otitis]EKU93677.1 anaerobic ribonucleoside-triphosphate reductase [Alloiococcus otitis ATCC 51267]SUU80273.1 Anaerobic ribonucleoside-triphosphate reductase [Alloiococcus otitis]
MVRTQQLQLNVLVQPTYVNKRDGRQQAFDFDKFYHSYSQAYQASQESGDQVSSADFQDYFLQLFKDLPGDQIQAAKLYQLMEDYLEDSQQTDCLEAFQSIRRKKVDHFKKQRDINQRINTLLDRDQDVVHENANKDSNVFNTQRDLTAGIVAKATGLKMLPDHVANAHEKGEIHYHDLDYSPYSSMSNCCLIDFKSMFEEGFYIGNAEVETPKSIQTATAQTAQIIANVASSQYGGCTFDRADQVLAPYAEKNYQKHLAVAQKWIEDPDKQKAFAKERTKKDIYDAMQSLEYEINTLYTSQGQTPFTTVGFGLGQSWFEREIQKAILQVRIKGLGREERTAIFPKLIFTIKEGLNRKPDDPNYDVKELALECSTKRMYPDIINYDKIIELTGSFKAPMGCRSFLQGWRDEKGQEVNAGRMNLGVVTLNLPRIAMESGGDFNRFKEILDDRLDIAHDALVFKANRVMDTKPENAPILYIHGAFGKRTKPGGDIKSYFKNRRATVSLGYIGLYEVATVFYGGQWEDNSEAKAFTLDIVRYLKEKTGEWSDQEDLHFSLYATPSESLTDRFNRLDKDKFGLVENITDKEYYTNSFHYDVRKDPTPFEKLDFEKDYPKYSSGGFIHYCEYPKLQTNPKALEAVWDYAYDKVGYLGTNTPIDHCYECGYDGDFKPTDRGFECPSCGNTNPDTCDVVKRTCGYLGNPQKRPMVHGRHKEIQSRVKHVKGES